MSIVLRKLHSIYNLGLIKSVQNFKQSVSSTTNLAIYKNNYHPEIFQNLTFTVKFKDGNRAYSCC